MGKVTLIIYAFPFFVKKRSSADLVGDRRCREIQLFAKDHAALVQCDGIVAILNLEDIDLAVGQLDSPNRAAFEMQLTVLLLFRALAR